MEEFKEAGGNKMKKRKAEEEKEDAIRAEDEIVWPPCVIVENTRLCKTPDGRWTGLGNTEMSCFLAGQGVSAFHAYLCYCNDSIKARFRKLANPPCLQHLLCCLRNLLRNLVVFYFLYGVLLLSMFCTLLSKRILAPSLWVRMSVVGRVTQKAVCGADQFSACEHTFVSDTSELPSERFFMIFFPNLSQASLCFLLFLLLSVVVYMASPSIK